jgi:predicted transcriptional regulator
MPMAKTPPKGKDPVSATVETEEVKAVRLELPPNLHRELRIEAAKRDTHMSALARQAVEEFLDRARKGGK